MLSESKIDDQIELHIELDEKKMLLKERDIEIDNLKINHSKELGDQNNTITEKDQEIFKLKREIEKLSQSAEQLKTKSTDQEKNNSTLGLIPIDDSIICAVAQHMFNIGEKFLSFDEQYSKFAWKLRTEGHKSDIGVLKFKGLTTYCWRMFFLKNKENNVKLFNLEVANLVVENKVINASNAQFYFSKCKDQIKKIETDLNLKNQFTRNGAQDLPNAEDQEKSLLNMCIGIYSDNLFCCLKFKEMLEGFRVEDYGRVLRAFFDIGYMRLQNVFTDEELRDQILLVIETTILRAICLLYAEPSSVTHCVRPSEKYDLEE